MSIKHYYINKKNNNELIYLDFDKLKGFDFSPKNSFKYDGIVVNKMVIIKPSMIEKILKRKIKHKLDLYLRLIMRFIESDDSDNGESIREALNDLTRYKSIINHKYKKYLDEKYLKLPFFCKIKHILLIYKYMFGIILMDTFDCENQM